MWYSCQKQVLSYICFDVNTENKPELLHTFSLLYNECYYFLQTRKIIFYDKPVINLEGVELVLIIELGGGQGVKRPSSSMDYSEIKSSVAIFYFPQVIHLILRVFFFFFWVQFALQIISKELNIVLFRLTKMWLLESWFGNVCHRSCQSDQSRCVTLFPTEVPGGKTKWCFISKDFIRAV